MPRQRKSDNQAVAVLLAAGRPTLLRRRGLRSVRVVDPEKVFMRLHAENPRKPTSELQSVLPAAVVADVLGGERPVVLETSDYTYVGELFGPRVALLYATLDELGSGARRSRESVLEAYTDLFTCKIDRATGTVVDVITRKEIAEFLARGGGMPKAAVARATEAACRKLGLGAGPAAVHPAVPHELLLDDPATMAGRLAKFLRE